VSGEKLGRPNSNSNRTFFILGSRGLEGGKKVSRSVEIEKLSMALSGGIMWTRLPIPLLGPSHALFLYLAIFDPSHVFWSL
jgi:hypothetical protein